MNGPNNDLLTSLHNLLSTYFNQEELRTLCFNLSVRYDNLPGEGTSAKARELILYLGRQKRLPELVQLGKERKPSVDWPEAPANFDIAAANEHHQTESTHQKDITNQTINIYGNIKGGIVNPGGNVSIEGPLSVDMGETPGIQSQGEVVLGDKTELSGDFQGSDIHFKSQLNDVTQSLRKLPYGDDHQKSELIDLIAVLLSQLEQAPKNSYDDVGKIIKCIHSLIREMDENSPDKEMMVTWGEALKRSVASLKYVLPNLMTITTKIIDHAHQLVS